MQPEDFAATFAVSRETIARLAIYERLLQEWGKTLSLVSRSTLDDIWQRHFADSAQLFSYLSPLPAGEAGRLMAQPLAGRVRGLINQSPHPNPLPKGEGINLPLPHGKGILDMGTGAGFPGMVLAIMGAPAVHLSDNNQKKCEFLHHVASETGTDVIIHNCKVEAVPDIGFHTVTARALTSLDQLLALSSRFFGPATQGLFLKGKSYRGERDEAARRWNFACVATPSLTNPDSAILRVTQLTRRKAA